MKVGSPTPNVLIAQGAWTNESTWDRVIALLHAAGHSVSLVPIGLMTLEQDIARMQAILKGQNAPTILVGHSTGGAVISGAANGSSNAVGLVYVSALAPDENETINDLIYRRGYQPEPGLAHLVPADNLGLIYVEQTAFLSYVAQDIDPAAARMMAIAQRPINEHYLSEPAGTPAWRSLPSWWLLSANDLMVNPALQFFEAKRMNATVLSVTSSHVSPVARPREIVELIREAADFTKLRS